MRIMGIYASNYLSFGAGAIQCEESDKFQRSASTKTVDENTEETLGLRLTRIPTDLLMIVGPNGCGKTNVIRVVETILHGLSPSNEESPPIPHVHSPDSPTELAMDIEFDNSGIRDL